MRLPARTLSKTLLSIALLSAGAAAGAAAAESGESDPDPLAPLAFLLGTWRGEGSGIGGDAVVEHRYERVIQERFIRLTTRSESAPVADGGSGEVHEDVGYFSYDPDRRLILLRQFLSEGYVNTYVLERASDAELVLVTESTEGAGGTAARVSWEIAGPAEYVMRLDLAPPGGDFFECRVLRMRRTD